MPTEGLTSVSKKQTALCLYHSLKSHREDTRFFLWFKTREQGNHRDTQDIPHVDGWTSLIVSYFSHLSCYSSAIFCRCRMEKQPVSWGKWIVTCDAWLEEIAHLCLVFFYGSVKIALTSFSLPRIVGNKSVGISLVISLVRQIGMGSADLGSAFKLVPQKSSETSSSTASSSSRQTQATSLSHHQSFCPQESPGKKYILILVIISTI